MFTKLFRSMSCVPSALLCLWRWTLVGIWKLWVRFPPTDGKTHKGGLSWTAESLRLTLTSVRLKACGSGGHTAVVKALHGGRPLVSALWTGPGLAAGNGTLALVKEVNNEGNGFFFFLVELGEHWPQLWLWHSDWGSFFFGGVQVLVEEELSEERLSSQACV